MKMKINTASAHSALIQEEWRNGKRHRERAKRVLLSQIKKIKEAPADSQIAKANQHLFDGILDSGGFGIGAGELSCAELDENELRRKQQLASEYRIPSLVGRLGAVLDCTLAVAMSRQCADAASDSCVVSFNVSGKGGGLPMNIGAFTSQVVGTFLVNPKNVAGECYFVCADVDIGGGGVSLSLSSKLHGTLYGTFVGDTEGFDVLDMSGNGILSVS
jgi:hypothetical protein|tara:strand:- start:4899 stop:5549 length:651 start_codon:yes stop_codon:yes gene_type:complete